jgi:undecaprenyl-diphosphatase
MDTIQVLILSIVEGITEFLPISSTGHLLLATNFLKIPQTEFVKSFEIIIQLGAILSVVVLYWKKLIVNFKLWKNIIAAFIPTAVAGLLLYDFIKEVLFENILITVLALLIGGILLIVIEKFHKPQQSNNVTIEQLSLKQSFLIGIAQSFSIIPGTSRAASTIIGGLLVGLKRKAAVEFSFLLAIPTMMAATGLDLVKSNFNFSSNEILILAIGFIGSFITALLVVKWFIKFIQTNNFFWFGVYRIVLATFYIILLSSN